MTHARLTFREGTADDRDILSRLPIREVDGPMLAKWLPRLNRRTAIAQLPEGTIVGFVMCHIYNTYAGITCSVDAIAVRGDCRRLGVGSRLLAMLPDVRTIVPTAAPIPVARCEGYREFFAANGFGRGYDLEGTIEPVNMERPPSGNNT